MAKIILDPSLRGGSKFKYKMSRFNISKLVESAFAKIGWLIVIGAALSLSWYSLYFVSLYYGLPIPLAIITSTAFDGGALVCADLTLKYAKSSDSALGPRCMVFIFAAVSAYLNAQHAVINKDNKAAIVLYASPPIVAIIIFELYFRYEKRNALRKAGRVPKKLPIIGRNAYLLFPFRSIKVLRKIVKHRLDQVDDPENGQQMVTNVLVMPEPRTVRAWAISQGFRIGEKGRISAEIVQAFLDKQVELTANDENKRPNLSLMPPNPESITDNDHDHQDNPGGMGA